MRIGVTVALRLAAAVFQAATLVLLARNTPIADFGVYSAGYGIFLVTGAILGLGLPTWLLRASAEGPAGLPNRILSATLSLTTVNALIVSAALLVLTARIDIALALLGAGLVDGWLRSIQNWLFGSERPRIATGLMAGIRGVLLGSVAVAPFLAISPFATLSGAAFAVVAVGASILLGTHSLKRPTKSSFLGGRSYWSVSSVAMVQQLDVPILAFTLGAAPSAAYATGFRLASAIHIVTSLLAATFVPQMSREVMTGSSQLPPARKKLFALSAAYAGIVLSVSPVTYWLAPALLGPQYLAFALVFPFIFASAGLSVMTQAVQSVMYGLGEAARAVVPTLAATVTVLASVGAVGFLDAPVVYAAVGLLVAQMGLLILMYATYRRILKRRRSA